MFPLNNKESVGKRAWGSRAGSLHTISSTGKACVKT